VCEQFPEAPGRIALAAASSALQTRRGRMGSVLLPGPIRGDLDTIVLKALRKQPEHRYQSVELLAADVRRYLSRRPIAARPQTFRYRTSAFVRRHRWPVAAVSALALLLIAYVVTLTNS